MNYLVIGDEDTVLGFAYAGIPGVVVESAAQASEALERACEDASIGAIIINDVIAKSIRSRINEVRFGRPRPVIVEVPGPGGPDPERPQLIKLIQEAVGISI